MPNQPHHRVHPTILQHARDLRHPLTPAEKKVWAGVRNRMLGYKIRRQHPIFRFIADFYCEEAKLVIEIDGDSHNEPEQAAYDAARTAWLEANGYRVIRFSNRHVHENLDDVLETIRAVCKENSDKHSKSLSELSTVSVPFEEFRQA